MPPDYTLLARKIVRSMMPSESAAGCDMESHAFDDLLRKRGVHPDNWPAVTSAVQRELNQIAEHGGFGEYTA